MCIRSIVLLFLASFSLFLPALHAQRFNAAILAGTNASQIDGDDLAGYDKLGLTGGLKGIAWLNDNFDLSTELLFSQRGSKSDIFSSPEGTNVKIHLNYIEVPFIISYKDWYQEEDYHKIRFSGGLSYGKLISSSSSDEINQEPNDLQTLSKLFKSDDLSFILGGSFFANPHLAFTFRFTSSIIPLYKTKTPGPLNVLKMRGYFLTFRAEYHLN